MSRIKLTGSMVEIPMDADEAEAKPRRMSELTYRGAYADSQAAQRAYARCKMLEDDHEKYVDASTRYHEIDMALDKYFYAVQVLIDAVRAERGASVELTEAEVAMRRAEAHLRNV